MSARAARTSRCGVGSPASSMSSSAAQDLLEGDPRLEPRERRADAEVDAPSEGHVVADLADARARGGTRRVSPNCCGSRLAAANDSCSLLPIGIDWSCMVHSVALVRNSPCTGESNRSASSTASGIRPGSARRAAIRSAVARATGTASCRAGWWSSRGRRPAADSRGGASRACEITPWRRAAASMPSTSSGSSSPVASMDCAGAGRDRRRRPRCSPRACVLASTYVSTSPPLRAATASLLQSRKSSRRSESTPSSSAIASAGKRLGEAGDEVAARRRRRRRRSARR